MEEIKEKKNSAMVVLLGLSLVILGSILVFGKPATVTPEPANYSFEYEPVNVEGFSDDEGNNSESAQRIVITDLSIDLPVERSKVLGGYWEVFDDKAGWGEGSGYPGESGNQVIFAHAREGLFLPLKEVDLGMAVNVYTESNQYDYEIVEIKEVTPDQVEVIAPTDDETLTLYTCSGYNDSKRLIVVAKPSGKAG